MYILVFIWIHHGMRDRKQDFGTYRICIRQVSDKPTSLLTYTNYGSSEKLRPNIIPLDPLDSSEFSFKVGFLYMYMQKVSKSNVLAPLSFWNIRIYHECKSPIGKSVLMITVWHHHAYQTVRSSTSG